MAEGTFECPICGFDKPHTHEPMEVELRYSANQNQRDSMKKRAEYLHMVVELRAEFDADPRAFVARYGTCSRFGDRASTACSYLVLWLLERIDSINAENSRLAVETIETAAPARLVAESRDAALAMVRELEVKFAEQTDVATLAIERYNAAIRVLAGLYDALPSVGGFSKTPLAPWIREAAKVLGR
jgi:hypothetical protein